VIHHSRELVSTAPEFNGRKLYITPGDAWQCVTMETHFMKLPMNGSCADVDSRGSLEVSVATEVKLFLRAMCFSNRCSLSLSLCGLPLLG
jgi:hypothetical protein